MINNVLYKHIVDYHEKFIEFYCSYEIYNKDFHHKENISWTYRHEFDWGSRASDKCSKKLVKKT